VLAAAAHGGGYGLRLTNAAGQYGLVVKGLSVPVPDSVVSFWVRVGSGGGLQTLAQARDQSSSQTMWGLLYDAGRQGLYFYPYSSSGAREIFTGAGSVPVDTWVQVQVQYTATASGGAQLYINGQTSPGWGVSGDYTRTANLQRLQLWNDSTAVTDFDDVEVDAPAAGVPGAPTAVHGTPLDGTVSLAWSAPASDGGNPITGYRITPYLGTTAQAPIMTTSTVTTQTVSGLSDGTPYTFTVAAVNAFGVGPESAPSPQLTPVARPASTLPPVVSGTPQQGQTLSTSNGSWSNSPSAYTYAWEDCDTGTGNCGLIAGATNSSYTLTAGDVGHTVRSVVTAGNASGSSSAASAATDVVGTAAPTITASLPSSSGACSTRFSSQEVWPDTTTALSPPGGGYPSVFQRIDTSGLDIWRVQAVDGYDDASTTLVSPSAYTDSIGQHLTAWNFNTLDKQMSDGPTSAVRELDMVSPPDALWTGTAPLGGDGSAQGALADETYQALAQYEANVVRYFRTGVSVSGSGSSVTYTGTSMTDTTKDFSAYGGGGYALTATVLDANGFPDWETATITSVTNGGHSVNFSGWSRAQSNALSRVSTPAAGAAYNLASVTPPITTSAPAKPWPRPPSVGNVQYFELFNEPDLSNSQYPRVSPALPAPTPTLTGINVPGGTLTPGTTYAYRVSAANIGGALSLPGAEVSVTLPSGANAIQIIWSPTSKLGLWPFAYQLYGRTAGAEQAMVVVGKDASTGLTWIDKGSVQPSGAMPTTDDTPGFQLWRAHEYTRMWNVVAPAMKAVDGSIKLVGPTISNPISLANSDVVTTVVTNGPADRSWISRDDYVTVLMSGSSPKPDAVSIHAYGSFRGSDSTETEEWDGLSSAITNFTSQDALAIGSTPVFLDETNIDAGFFGNPPTATNLRAETQMGAAWLADSYIQWCSRAPQVTELMQHAVYNGDVAWGLFSGASYANSTTCIPQPACQNLRASQPNLQYWLTRWMNAWLPAGSAVVPVGGVPNGFAAFAVKSSANTVTVVVVNTQVGSSDGNGTPGNVAVQLAGANVTSAQQLTIDGNTDMLNGPSVGDLGPRASVSLSVGGYGVAMVRFTTA
jgi:titin